MEFATLIPVFVALFVIIDPIGLAPLFVALTAAWAWPKGGRLRCGRP